MHNSNSGSGLRRFNLTGTLLYKAALLALILWSFSFRANAQNSFYEHLDDAVVQFIKDLKAQKIDTICVYEKYSNGKPPLLPLPIGMVDERCDSDPIYIIWRKNGQTFLTKNDCFKYSTIEIKIDTIWNNVFSNWAIIKTERIKPFQLVHIEHGKKEIWTSGVDHSNYLNFMIIAGDNKIEKSLDEFDFQEKNEFGAGGEININYKHNKNLKGKIFVDELAKLTTEIEENKRLTRISR